MTISKNKVTAMLCAVLLIAALIFDSQLTFASAPIPAVLAQNEEVISNIKDYGPDFVVDYISQGTTDAQMLEVLEQVQEISDDLTKGIDDEYEMMRVLADYVSNLVAYDHDALHNDVSFDTICIKNVLERKRTTCAGFSNLFSALTQAQGLYCVNIRGSAPEAELGITRANLDDENTPINHEWTAVWYEAEQRWVYVDCTWNSLSRYENGEFSWKNAVTTYFDMDIEKFSITHKGDSAVFRDFFEVAQVYSQGEITTTSASDANAVIITTTTTAKKDSVIDKTTSLQPNLQSENVDSVTTKTNTTSVSDTVDSFSQTSKLQETSADTDLSDTVTSLTEAVSDSVVSKSDTTTITKATYAEGALISDTNGTLYTSDFEVSSTSSSENGKRSSEEDSNEKALKVGVIILGTVFLFGAIGFVIYRVKTNKKALDNESYNSHDDEDTIS